MSIICDNSAIPLVIIADFAFSPSFNPSDIPVPIAKIFKLSKEYSYIEKSIKNFPEGNRLTAIAKGLGFSKVEYRIIFCNN